MDSQLSWMPYNSKTPRIKEEAPDANGLFPSPSTSSLSVTSSSSSSSSRRGSSTGPKRQRPYPPLAPDLPTRRTHSDMSSSHPYGTWSGLRSGSGRSHPPVERRSSDGEQSAYPALNPYMNDSYMGSMDAEYRPPSSNSSLTTSSLTGAMGDAGLSNPSRGSRSPPSNAALYSGTIPSQDLSWTNNLSMSNSAYPSHGNLGYPTMATPVTAIPFDYAASRNPSPPDSIAPPSPPYPQHFADQFSRGQMSMGSSRADVGYPTMSSSYDVPMSMDGNTAQQELRRLRRRVQELELELSRSRSALEGLRSGAPRSTGLPTPPHSSSFQAGWKARTEARKKLFCSLNRAGNALCAWHDSRRERRVHPPRNAPPGYLNCGCTYNEALFEESLSRHGVGSYHPGETVRMDPALRNPLLKLLEKRYGYKDGDFEHDPVTEEWAEGESPSIWEQKAHSGQIVKKRPDPSKDEHRS